MYNLIGSAWMDTSLYGVFPFDFFLSFFFYLKKKVIYFQLKDNCFTIVYWFLPYISMNQPEVFICLFPLGPPFHLPPPPTPVGCYRAPVWVPESHSESPLAIYVTHGSVYVSKLLFPFVSPSFLPAYHPEGAQSCSSDFRSFKQNPWACFLSLKFLPG